MNKTHLPLNIGILITELLRGPPQHIDCMSHASRTDRQDVYITLQCHSDKYRQEGFDSNLGLGTY